MFKFNLGVEQGSEDYIIEVEGMCANVLFSKTKQPKQSATSQCTDPINV